MNKVLSRLALCLFCFLIPIHDAAAAPALTAEAAILMDLQSGEILYCKNAYESRPPASLTKVMTTILAIEHQPDLSYTATVSPAAAATGESRLNLQAGEQITLENLLYGALLKSGNDACVAIAENVAPDEEDFVWRMNLKAQLLGCVSTTFQNTNGLPDDQHKSCAYDLAVIARYALQNDTFSQIVQTRYATIHWDGAETVSDQKYQSLAAILSWCHRRQDRYDQCSGAMLDRCGQAGRSLLDRCCPQKPESFP